MRRVLDLSGATSSEVFRLRVDKGCLTIAHGTADDPEEVRIPLPEVGVLVLGSRSALTGAVLGHVPAHGGAILSLDERFCPAGLMLPYWDSASHAARLRLQLERLPALAPGLWQQVVRAKIAAQARLVPEVGRWGAEVEPGDPRNVEASAAREYFPKLFGAGFSRRDETDDRNAMLNYGYAVLRAAVARSVCAAGLHPAIGIHHRSGRDAFALADDLVEPLRPGVDEVVVQMRRGSLDASKKRAILSVLLAEVKMSASGSRVRRMEACDLGAQSLIRILETGAGDLDLPESP